MVLAERLVRALEQRGPYGIWSDSALFREATGELSRRIIGEHILAIGIRGAALAAPIALERDIPLILAAKDSDDPSLAYSDALIDYSGREKRYAIPRVLEGRVSIIDDWFETGRTLRAIIEREGGMPVQACFVFDEMTDDVRSGFSIPLTSIARLQPRED